MVLFNYSTRELTAKIVYYGPGICGKTTNLQFIHENLPGAVRGKMLSLATKTDRTLFFDFLPIDLGEIRGMKTRVQLYTVPGQVFYNETRKLVLKGVDGIVFVADSQETMLGANVESFKNLEENLKGHGMKLAEMPHVIQFNKRDLPKLSAIEDMNAALNKYNSPFYESVATTGIGVQDTLKAIVKLVLLNLTRKYETKSVVESAVATAPPVAVTANASVAMGSASPARASAPVAESPAPVAAQETGRASIPLSPVEAPAAEHRAGSPSRTQSRKVKSPPVEAVSTFGEDEIDGLVGEVEEIEAPVAAAPTDDGAWMGSAPEDEDDSARFGSSVPIEDLLPGDAPAAKSRAGGEFEVDRGFDPEWNHPAATPAAPSSARTPASGSSAGGDVLLTEVASDEDLFSDPSLEIARLAGGETREILVPVLLGEGASARRFKLSIRLRFDPVK